MAAPRALLLAACCAALAGATRRIAARAAARSVVTGGEKFAMRFCPSVDITLSCSEHFEISVYSAFYNTRKDSSCPAFKPRGRKESCTANFTDAVAADCNGQQECVVPAKSHPFCKKKPFSGSRIVWYCKPKFAAMPVPSLPPPPAQPVEETEEVIAACGSDCPMDALEQLDTEQVVRYSRKWCTEEDAHLSCDDGEEIRVHLAGYSQWPDQQCHGQLNLDSCFVDSDGKSMGTSDCGCDLGDTEMVAGLCNGQQRCVVPPSKIRMCSKQVFTFLVAIWDCVAK